MSETAPERRSASVIMRYECPICHEEPDAYGLQHQFNCPGKLEITDQNAHEVRYVALDEVVAALREKDSINWRGRWEAAVFIERRFSGGSA